MNLIIYLAISITVAILITYFITNSKANKKLKDYETIENAIKIKKQEYDKLVIDLAGTFKEKKQDLKNSENEISNAIKEKIKDIEIKTLECNDIQKKITELQIKLDDIDAETKVLQNLKKNGESIQIKLVQNTDLLKQTKEKIELNIIELDESNSHLHSIKSEIDLYSRINDFVDVGHYETPAYLFETSLMFQEEIKLNRLEQKELIKVKEAISCIDSDVDKKIIDGQIKLMLTSFNVETDSLISKVSPSNFSKTLERIEKLANTLEKSAANLHCGFNINYIKLKFEECKLQYQFTLKKKEEQEEQRLIREQIKEEQRAIKEFEKAILEAEKEELLYSDLLEKARNELELANDEQRLITQQRIDELELQLAEAQLKEQRAKSMAEQTRKGHVYIISNIGSFGENVYKIGLTRRLEPMDRVKELGDASVPFKFDVHAMIYVEDAPSLERALHKEFTNKRVNAVNLRKEFFRVDLDSIKDAVKKVAGIDAEFKMTILAEEYYETKRLTQSQELLAL